MAPSNIHPLGNLLTSHRASISRARSLGLLSQLPDALISQILEALLASTDPQPTIRALLNLSQTSLYTRAFALDDDLWRRLTFTVHTPSAISKVPYNNSWYRLFAYLSGSKRTPYTPKSIVYSDVLFHKRFLLTHPILPSWTALDNIPRISYPATSRAQFRAQFETESRPVVIRGVVTNWPAANWTLDALVASHPNTKFHAGGYTFTLPDYSAYAHNVQNRDDQPLYIFDRDFASIAPDLAKGYTVPEYFQPDLFEALGNQRPDNSWLIIGPARSGSTFHKDPNHTSAWNAVLSGSKKWVMFPPDSPPPGVHPTADGGDVRTTVSVTEWFANFYDADMLRQYNAVECVVKSGEMIFVPAGWWHCVLNLEMTVALTQNFVSEVHFATVAQWLRDRPADISGCRNDEQKKFVRDNFESAVLEKFPGLRKTNVCREDLQGCGVSDSKKRKTALWQSLRSSTDRSVDDPQVNASFSFGF